MEERTPIDHRLDEMDLGIYLGILRAGWRRLALLSVAAGAISLIVTFSVPNMYQATAVITPVTEEGRQSPSIGALASLGVVVPGPNKVEDLETLFRSKDLSVRTIAKHNLWAVALADRYDSATGKMKGGWLRRLIGLARTGRPPAAWDAIRAAERLLRVEVNKKAGTIAISFESTSPEASADVVRHYLEEGKDRLQEEALDRARLNKEFIQAQIGKTVDALNRERLRCIGFNAIVRERSVAIADIAIDAVLQFVDAAKTNER